MTPSVNQMGMCDLHEEEITSYVTLHSRAGLDFNTNHSMLIKISPSNQIVTAF